MNKIINKIKPVYPNRKDDNEWMKGHNYTVSLLVELQQEIKANQQFNDQIMELWEAYDSMETTVKPVAPLISLKLMKKIIEDKAIRYAVELYRELYIDMWLEAEYSEYEETIRITPELFKDMFLFYWDVISTNRCNYYNKPHILVVAACIYNVHDYLYIFEKCPKLFEYQGTAAVTVVKIKGFGQVSCLSLHKMKPDLMQREIRKILTKDSTNYVTDTRRQKSAGTLQHGA